MDSYTKIVSSKFIVDSPMVLSSPLGYSSKHLVNVMHNNTCVCITLKTYFMNPDYDIRVRSDFEK